uniref:Anillin homology domain-containing protein n=1 Tax=Oryzias latipes TaxID=8090 RepID=A0A3B3HC53_ORYLA
MREGASKLLAACSQKDQALEASKSLLTCNARILALLSQLQKIRKAQILERAGLRSDGDPDSLNDAAPCTGKVALSDLRFPLMWKDSEYFKNKGELHRCAVFCLLWCDSEIHDTDIVMVDRTLTDICFEEPIIFDEVGPEFQLRVELYSSCVVEDASPAVLAIKKGTFLGGSLGYSSGKKIRAAFESAAGSWGCEGAALYLTVYLVYAPAPTPGGPKYNLLAHTTLTIENVLDGFKTHDLTVLATEDSPFWLPLYGNLCCRLVAQPLCMTQPVMSGQLTVKLKDSNIWENIHADLKGQTLRCYQTKEDLESGNNLMLLIPIRKVSSFQKSCKRREVLAPSSSYSLMQKPPEGSGESTQTDTDRSAPCTITHTCLSGPSANQKWATKLTCKLNFPEQWKHSCDQLMKIEVPKSKKPSPLLQGSLFHEIGNDKQSDNLHFISLLMHANQNTTPRLTINQQTTMHNFPSGYFPSASDAIFPCRGTNFGSRRAGVLFISSLLRNSHSTSFLPSKVSHKRLELYEFL